jgi:hypothetical protein
MVVTSPAPRIPWSSRPPHRALPPTPALVFTPRTVTALVDLVPPPYARADACASWCPHCGADGSQPALTGAALARDVALSLDRPLARVGLWLSLPPGERALRVSITGDALSLVALTAVRLHDVDTARADDDAPWRGAPLSGRDPLVAELRPPPGASLAVVSFAGVARALGEAELVVRVTASRGGCLSARLRLRVGPAPHTAFDGAYLALAAPEAPRLLRWIDAASAALVRHGHWRGAVRALVETRAARIEGAVRVHEVGLDGARWTLARAALTRGDVTAVTLWDPCAPERASLDVALDGGAPCEASAWAVGDAPALRDAWWRAADATEPGTLQAVAGRFAEPVAPRVATSWERSRGVRSLPCDAAWLGRFARAPGEKTYCRGRVYADDAARACWPGAMELS